VHHHTCWGFGSISLYYVLIGIMEGFSTNFNSLGLNILVISFIVVWILHISLKFQQ
jgi:hypothetical protein